MVEDDLKQMESELTKMYQIVEEVDNNFEEVILD